MDAAVSMEKNGEWTGFDLGLDRLKTEGGEDNVIISRVKGSRLPATVTCSSRTPLP